MATKQPLDADFDNDYNDEEYSSEEDDDGEERNGLDNSDVDESTRFTLADFQPYKEAPLLVKEDPLKKHHMEALDKDNAYLLFFDGSYRKSHGEALGGIVIYDPQGNLVAKRGLTAQNDNEAEYATLKKGLQIFLEQGLGVWQSDALLVVKQLERGLLEIWDNLCSFCENKSATNKVFLIKKLFDLCIKEEGSISTHIKEFNIIFTQFATQGLVFDEETKCIFLLCNLSSSWNTFCTAISNSAPGTGLLYNDVLKSLFAKEIREKSLKGKKDDDAYVASDRQRDRTQSHAKSKDRGGRSKSQDSMCNVECYHCHKKWHVKKDCKKWQQSKKDKQPSETSKSQKSYDSNKGKAS
ncbi:hypothetical protein L7F22_047720 [Adiantum nelumboides]|nr:hypothetical protein [Adiantum nelumboides]